MDEMQANWKQWSRVEALYDGLKKLQIAAQPQFDVEALFKAINCGTDLYNQLLITLVQEISHWEIDTEVGDTISEPLTFEQRVETLEGHLADLVAARLAVAKSDVSSLPTTGCSLTASALPNLALASILADLGISLPHPSDINPAALVRQAQSKLCSLIEHLPPDYSKPTFAQMVATPALTPQQLAEIDKVNHRLIADYNGRVLLLLRRFEISLKSLFQSPALQPGGSAYNKHFDTLNRTAQEAVAKLKATRLEHSPWEALVTDVAIEPRLRNLLPPVLVEGELGSERGVVQVEQRGQKRALYEKPATSEQSDLQDVAKSTVVDIAASTSGRKRKKKEKSRKAESRTWRFDLTDESTSMQYERNEDQVEKGAEEEEEEEKPAEETNEQPERRKKRKEELKRRREERKLKKQKRTESQQPTPSKPQEAGAVSTSPTPAVAKSTNSEPEVPEFKYTETKLSKKARRKLARQSEAEQGLVVKPRELEQLEE